MYLATEIAKLKIFTHLTTYHFFVIPFIDPLQAIKISFQSSYHLYFDTFHESQSSKMPFSATILIHNTFVHKTFVHMITKIMRQTHPLHVAAISFRTL